MDEASAIARLKRGDIGGLDLLVENYQVRAVRAAFLIIHDRAVAEDVVQDAFIRVYERIGQFDATRPFGPWFFQIVARLALTAATRQDRCVSWDGAVDEESLICVDPGPGLDAALEAAETREALRNVLNELSPEQRAAVVLRYYLELSEVAIAERLNCPTGTVKSRLHAAKQRIERLLPSWISAGHDVHRMASRSTSRAEKGVLNK